MIDNEIPDITFYLPPDPVGWWALPGSTTAWATKFPCHKKPNWLVRFSMQYVFGWTYEDAL